ncbi:hypothetical protein [Gordonia jinghuaiqii]|nr:hypothetical protein [Gordonia jinghuaiqii]
MDPQLSRDPGQGRVGCQRTPIDLAEALGSVSSLRKISDQLG